MKKGHSKIKLNLKLPLLLLNVNYLLRLRIMTNLKIKQCANKLKSLYFVKVKLNNKRHVRGCNSNEQIKS